MSGHAFLSPSLPLIDLERMTPSFLHCGSRDNDVSSTGGGMLPRSTDPPASALVSPSGEPRSCMAWRTRRSIPHYAGEADPFIILLHTLVHYQVASLIHTLVQWVCWAKKAKLGRGGGLGGFSIVHFWNGEANVVEAPLTRGPVGLIRLVGCIHDRAE
jgi:hypothetical protein